MNDFTQPNAASAPLRVVSLFSGSEGNATYICGEKGGGILIDAGVSARALSTAFCELGRDLASVEGIFITHEHTDHTKGLRMLAKKYRIPIHMTRPSFERYRLSSDPPPTLVVHDLLYEAVCGSLRITSFPTRHDSAACVGYVVDNGSHAVGVATDLGIADACVKEHLCGCESVVIESNHDPEMLRYCSYPSELKRRIGSDNGHLSNPACAELLTTLAERGTKNILLAHISRESNTPEKALAVSREALDKSGHADVRVLTASPQALTVLVG